MKPKVLLLSTSLGMGGADRQILYLAHALLAQDHEVRLVSMTPLEEMGQRAIGEGLPIMYQFLPYKDDPNESLFVIRLMAPLPDGAPAMPSAPMTYLDFDEYFESLAEWQPFGTVLDQDMRILPHIQKGLRAAAPDRAQTTLGRYQEQLVALLHEFVEERIREGAR